LAETRWREVDPLGDANTSFFHKRSNGIQRKKKIISLEDGHGSLVADEELNSHVANVYKRIYGPEEVLNIHIQRNLQDIEDRVTLEENDGLIKLFTME
jgi:hypothetical protein